MFWAIFKTLKQILYVFIYVSGSFIDFDACFKALMHLGKGSVQPITHSLFFSGFVSFLLVFCLFLVDVH